MKQLLRAVTIAASVACAHGEAPARYSPAAQAEKATPGDAMLTEYFRRESALISEQCLTEIRTKQDWETKRGDYCRQLQEMLGLLPMPDRTDLHAVVTGTLEQEEFSVEKVQFQALPHLYCTASLYIPKGLKEPAPTILYESGHARSFTNGISLGNKAVYQLDGAWYARNGYVCLVLDTLLAGEIQGIHTGTRDHGLWWWNSRGYTPAGVEAWFGIRALDYLCTRPEVDTNRFGITGHSGGGAYSWTITALDDRIKAAAPLAGMTDIEHHILHNRMDSHCDCNFPINIYRWDFPQLAAMAAPRPLLIGGTDEDGIFPVESTISIHAKVRRIYEICGAANNLGLIVAPGVHDEVPELRLAALRWFNRHLKGLDRRSEPAITVDAKRFFDPMELRVFEKLPTDAINTNIADTFVPMPQPRERSVPEMREVLLKKVFVGWPRADVPLDVRLAFAARRDGLRFRAWDFNSEHDVRLRLYLLEQESRTAQQTLELRILDEAQWPVWLAQMSKEFSAELTDELVTTKLAATAADGSLKAELEASGGALAFVAPRGIGLTAWSGDVKRQTRIRRRFQLLGKTLDGMRVWDIRRTVQALHFVRSPREITHHGITAGEGLDISRGEGDAAQVTVRAEGFMAVDALYAALFSSRELTGGTNLDHGSRSISRAEPGIRALDLAGLPALHRDGPDYLGVLKYADIPQIKKLVASEAEVKEVSR